MAVAMASQLWQRQVCCSGCKFAAAVANLLWQWQSRASLELSLWVPSLLTVYSMCCRSDRGALEQDLGPLLTALEVPVLSRAVQQSVPQVQGFSGSMELDPVIADCLVAVQRYLFHCRPEVYKMLDQTVMSHLLNLRYHLRSTLDLSLVAAQLAMRSTPGCHHTVWCSSKITVVCTESCQ